ncbi:XRE family transcriptional regulator [Microbacterium sp. PI-1]|uniref:helix-turn-helix domain-containing protein n=1 Tax=unclassified Microbacterium TaxID=2609290 RepID=UPI00103E960A|nr:MULTISPECIES: helix-turn-helix transcriptional regulator [unclassified Microbacterium]TCJ23800.1 XRE family transcriptional regulator [Microbacterium sp. PI-1]UUE20059.1 helix-turn-helix domain-containing protein [Microbacterium sp. J1-1]
MAHSWSTYFNGITEHATGSSIAQRLGVSGSKVSYWRRGERPPTPREAAHIARTFGRSPLEGLVAAGYLTAEDLSEDVSVVAHTLADYSDVELAEEMLRRAKP